MENPTQYHTIKIDGLSIFYREAGPKDSPTILLLHGLPSSSRMFEPLIRRLSASYPRENISATRDIHAVVLRGTPYDRTALDQLLAVIRAKVASWNSVDPK
jgi:pimeloyl-ACP methyl ester carboxylesterase